MGNCYRCKCNIEVAHENTMDCWNALGEHPAKLGNLLDRVVHIEQDFDKFRAESYASHSKQIATLTAEVETLRARLVRIGQLAGPRALQPVTPRVKLRAAMWILESIYALATGDAVS